MPELVNNKELLVFDLDGTLVRSIEAEQKFFFEQLEIFAGQRICRDITTYPNRSYASVINTLNCSERQKAWKFMECQMNDFALRHSWLPVNAGYNYLREAIDDKIPYFIVTGNFVEASKIKLMKSEIDVENQNIIATSLATESKYTLIKNVIRQTKVSNKQTLSLGDSSYDAHIAHELGVDFTLISEV